MTANVAHNHNSERIQLNTVNSKNQPSNHSYHNRRSHVLLCERRRINASGYFDSNNTPGETIANTIFTAGSCCQKLCSDRFSLRLALRLLRNIQNVSENLKSPQAFKMRLNNILLVIKGVPVVSGVCFNIIDISFGAVALSLH